MPQERDHGMVLSVEPGSTPLAGLPPSEEATLARLRFVADAGALLASSLDFEQTLRNVARLAVPALADWCIVYLTDQGRIERLTLEHDDPSGDEVERLVRSGFALDPGASVGVPSVVRTGRAEFHPNASAELLAADVTDPAGMAQVLEPLGICSWICVPIVSRDQRLGAISLVMAGSGRHYSEEDLLVAEELGRRAGTAVENARLYQAAQDAAEAAHRNAELIVRLHGVVAAGSRIASVRSAAEAMIEQAVDALGARAGVMALLEDDRTTLRIVGAIGCDDAELSRWEEFDIDSAAPISEAVRSGEVIVLHSLAERRARYGERVNPQSRHRAMVAVPLKDDDRVMGAVAISRNEDRQFGEDELVFVRAVGEHVSQAVARARLYEQERTARASSDEAGSRLAFLAAASDILGSSLDYGDTLGAVSSLLVPAIADWCMVDVVGEDGSLERAVTRHIDVSKAALLERLAEIYRADAQTGHGAAAAVASGEPQLYPDIPDELLMRVAPDEHVLSLLRSLGFRSAMVLPLRSRGRVLGVMTLATAESRRRYDDGDLALGQEIARRIAGAIDNARLFEAVSGTERRYRELVEGLQAVVWEADPYTGEVRFVSRAIEDMLGYPSSAWIGERERWIEIVHPADRQRVSAAREDAVRSKGNYDLEYRLIAADERTVWVRDVAQIAVGSDGRATLYGVMSNVTPRKRAEVEVLRSRERAAFLAEATSLLAATLDYDETLVRLAKLAIPLLADRCTIDTYDRDGVLRRLVTVDERNGEGEASTSDDERFADLIHQVITTGRALMIPDLADRGATIARALMIVPLAARGRTLGAIGFYGIQPGRTYDAETLKLAEDLARRAAVALDNARLYSEQRYVARTLQDSLLPPAIEPIEGLDIAARYQPAGEGYEVGGDFYDVFATGPSEYAMVIGDVMGKGAKAAATTALARYTVRAAALQSRRPSRILQMLNQAMITQSGDGRFATVAYCRVRRTEGSVRVTLACGGHPQPLLVRAHGTVEAVGSPGTVLGVFEEPLLTDRSVFLQPGDALVLYTDGITEARGPGGILGEDWLRDMLGRCAGLSADAVATRLEKAVIDQTGGNRRDDIALLVVRAR